MLSNIGNFLLFLNVLFSILIIYFSYNCFKISNTLIPKSIYHISIFQSTSILICFFTLIAAFLVSDFSLINVYQNSHSLKPIFYKISGTWGNHEGSLLLWVIILTIFSFLFLISNKSHPKNYRLGTLIIQNLLILGFLFFILFNSNPFSVISPVPNEGLGLNPILQDPALAIHPPLLYVGFVGSSIYFSAAMASLITNYNERSFIAESKSSDSDPSIFFALAPENTSFDVDVTVVIYFGILGITFDIPPSSFKATIGDDLIFATIF